MSTLLHRKRELERLVKTRVEFHRDDGLFLPIEVHIEFDGDDPDAWLGAGETHLDAIDNAFETLRIRSKFDPDELGLPRRKPLTSERLRNAAAEVRSAAIECDELNEALLVQLYELHNGLIRFSVRLRREGK